MGHDLWSHVYLPIWESTLREGLSTRRPGAARTVREGDLRDESGVAVDGVLHRHGPSVRKQDVVFAFDVAGFVAHFVLAVVIVAWGIFDFPFELILQNHG